MADKPILIFPAATVAARAKLPQSFGPPGPRPTHAEQKKRLAGRFQAMTQQFGTVQSDTGGVDPEQVVVFETVGSVGDFQRVVKKIPGMEWLGDFDADIADPDPGFLADGTEPAQLAGRLFVLMSNRTAYAELLRLWNAWTRARDEKLPYGFGALADVFKHLQDVRPWGPRDRVDATGIVAWWQKGLASNEPKMRFEAELWCRLDATSRASAYEHVQSVVIEAGGQCITQATITEIDYHGVLVELPAAAVRAAVDAIAGGTDTKLLRLTDVKYFAPMGEAAVSRAPDGAAVAAAAKPKPTGEPVAALLDGVPLSNHLVLQDRLVIDDPDGLSGQYQSGEHRHGTAMASLIVHGELDAAEAALASRLYVRPVMRPGRPDANNKRWEVFPPDQLPVDVIHRAVKRIAEGDVGQAAQGPRVRVVNLSVGDAAQLFDRQLSPWARLLDWLAWQYRLLFVVAAGNYLGDFSLPVPPASVAAMSDEDVRTLTLRAMAHQKVHRRLLAPAESVNALTVGALHGQIAADGAVGRLVDLLRGAQLPSPVSPVASGFRRAIKPEILVPGGRVHYDPKLAIGGATTADFAITPIASQPGQQVAAPGGTAVPPSHAVRISGTSNAAALTTRKAVQLVERIELLRREAGGDVLADGRTAVLLKAMLVHGASWNGIEQLFDTVFDGPDNGAERWWRIKRACAQFLGYGAADFDRGTVCTDQRVIVLGCGELKAGDGHLYRVPLPPALNARKVGRRLTITLAWITPTNPRHRNYCGADLWFDAPSSQLQVKRWEANDKMVKQGTVQHEVLEGDAAVPVTNGDTIPVQVNCRSDAGMSLSALVPYALMVSLETAEPLGVSVYDQVKVALDRLRAPVAVRAGTTRPRWR
ncbi:MAG: S8 family peptidase [Phycisphaerales bacterium]|nr:S8 family peptidase [Phycisphaerales bacterium]